MIIFSCNFCSPAATVTIALTLFLYVSDISMDTYAGLLVEHILGLLSVLGNFHLCHQTCQWHVAVFYKEKVP